MRLIKLTEEYKDLLVEMMDEWVKYNDSNINANKSPNRIFRDDYHDFNKFLNGLDSGNNIPSYYVPNKVFFLYDEERNILLGACDIRLKLNEAILFDGGHIGDGIRPSERGKGYGNLLLKLAIEKCNEFGINRILIVCNKDNYASKKAIINNGGVYENEVIGKYGNHELRFWIHSNNILKSLAENKNKEAFQFAINIYEESKRSNKYYKYLDDFISLNSSLNSNIRIRSFICIVSQVRWDINNVINENIDYILSVMETEKVPIIRQILKYLPDLIIYKPELKNYIINKINSINIVKYKESSRDLIIKDIEKIKSILI